MSVHDKFHWAKRVSRRDIQRLYESDAQGMPDEDLLDQIHYAIRGRSQMSEDELIPEILRLAPELAMKPED
jgi:hypothetical protein